MSQVLWAGQESSLSELPAVRTPGSDTPLFALFSFEDCCPWRLHEKCSSKLISSGILCAGVMLHSPTFRKQRGAVIFGPHYGCCSSIAEDVLRQVKFATHACTHCSLSVGSRIAVRIALVRTKMPQGLAQVTKTNSRRVLFSGLATLDYACWSNRVFIDAPEAVWVAVLLCGDRIGCC